MIYVIIAAVALVVFGAGLIWLGDDCSSAAASISGVIMIVVSVIIWILIPLAGYSWVAAKTKAEIINREYGTHYTREEIFYADDIIDTIQQIKRKRIEVNGDLFKDAGK